MNTPQNRPMYLFLIGLAVLSALGFQGWRTLFNNYAVEIAQVTGQQMGVIQGLREVPGFLALLVIYLLLFVREHRLAALSLMVMGLGVIMTGLMPTYTGLVVATLVMSFGFHYYETLNQSLTLQYFDITQSPVVMGRLRAVGSAANIVIGLIFLLVVNHVTYQTLYVTLGIFIMGGAAFFLLVNPTRKDLPLQRKNMVLRSRYWLFYVLTFLSGARRQIFVAFAVFLMVKKFGYTVSEVAMLFMLNNAVNYFLSPMIGRAVNRFGERRVLTLEYASLFFVFLGYAFTDSKLMVAVLYILDHIFYNFAMAIRSFFQKIADPRDIAPSMAVGFTINHIVAVVIPIAGGLLWMVDYRIPFVGGAVLSLVSLAFVQCIRTEKR
ncbi:Major Facilitator Superfamily protein [Desulfomicrobium norvegicum]|uniref:Major Facilitator Superfamily protein n=1 Tax=Desulfomicrobium norvegicum (strain DSM 1741 / NCIMB 8310) TaxID=52561 RepID=A0A8G2FDJ9_DESNO|nr:MFS transporter [Desulfomicrobium norvegicum]SFL50758.1 Major Facilitator Superfamily protein [Desulfomicrobium norvegicum]